MVYRLRFKKPRRCFAQSGYPYFYNWRSYGGCNFCLSRSRTGRWIYRVLKAEFLQITSLLYIVNQKKNDTILIRCNHFVIFSKKWMVIHQNRSKTGLYQTTLNRLLNCIKITRDFKPGLKVMNWLHFILAPERLQFIAKKCKKQVVGGRRLETAIEDANSIQELKWN